MKIATALFLKWFFFSKGILTPIFIGVNKVLLQAWIIPGLFINELVKLSRLSQKQGVLNYTSL
jgi:hypothetical protein